MKIVNAEEKHILAIRDIYAHHALHGTGGLETNPPDAYEMPSRLEKIRSPGLSWVAALQEDKVIGYCYLIRYRERYAYCYTFEDSIYITPTARRQGVGKALPCHVIGRAEAQGYRQLVAIVGDGNNQGSLKVHQQAGSMQVGTLKNTGLKYGLWLDMVLLQRNLGEGNGTLPSDSGVAT